MSGGIDSAVAAHHLTREYDRVTGVYLHMWTPPRDWSPSHHGTHSVTSLQHSADKARAVAERLGIDFKEHDVAGDFLLRIVEPFVMRYLHGATPNPCVECNEKIKLAALQALAAEIGAEHVATGHYVRVEYSDVHRRWVLRRGADAAKEQSYYLARLDAKRLHRFKTPLGDYTKDTIRERARSLNLPVAGEAESQEICFIPSDDYRSFLKHYAEDVLDTKVSQEGPIFDTSERIIGEHKGLPFYTIGQRKGLGISAPHPLYVVDIDTRRNALIVGRKEETYSHGFLGERPNWLSIEPPGEPFEADVQIRYRHTPAPAMVTTLEDSRVEIRFEQPQPAVTPGQLAVMYRGDILLGSAYIYERVK